MSSSKSVILSTCPKLAKTLQARLPEFGVSVRIDRSGEALGVGLKANGTRECSTRKKHLAKTRKRVQRIAWLRKHTKKATKLFVSGALPQADYAASHYGMSPPERASIDRLAARCVGKTGLQPCPTTLVNICMGFLPSSRQLRKQIGNFINAWQHADAKLRTCIVAGWGHIRDKFRVLEPAQRWKIANGGISSCVASLLDIGWLPARPNQWFDNATGRYANIGVSAWQDLHVLDAIEQAANDKAWALAANHFAGQELCEGQPCFDSYRAAKRQLLKDELHHIIPVLLGVVSGAAPLGSRMTRNQRCKRCGMLCETFQHRYFQCPGNSNAEALEYDWIRKTEWLCKQRTCG